MLPPAERGPILKPVIVTVKPTLAGITPTAVAMTIDVLAGALHKNKEGLTLLEKAMIVGITLESKNPKG
jgi:ABC-type Co2+ transport system permease subunit